MLNVHTLHSRNPVENSVHVVGTQLLPNTPFSPLSPYLLSLSLSLCVYLTVSLSVSLRSSIYIVPWWTILFANSQGRVIKGEREKKERGQPSGLHLCEGKVITSPPLEAQWRGLKRIICKSWKVPTSKVTHFTVGCPRMNSHIEGKSEIQKEPWFFIILED